MINEDLIIEHVNFGTDDLKDKYDLYNNLLEKIYIEMDISDKPIMGKTFDLISETYFKNKNLYKDSILDEIKSKSIVYFLKNKDEYLGGIICRNSNYYTDTYLLSIIMTFPQFRSHGYGKYLLKYVLDDLKIRYKVKHFCLACILNNHAAMNLYRSFGFSPMSTFMLKI